ncbi:MAG: porin [Hahellaceae bacterium]|nr:porin [Hahellaceae bacterium]MCP5210911.1 porin [Hahellaceae bacterium]
MRTIRKLGLVGGACVALSATAPASAFEYEGLSINGFASIVGGMGSDENMFRSTSYTDNFEFKPESKFALQVTADLGSGLSATTQIMAKGANNFNAEFEWAYLSYDFTDETTLRAGRLRVPFYKYSDYLDVGYAQPFVRPPLAMYNLDFSTFDGLSLLHNFSLASFDFNANITAGNVSDEFFTTTEPTEGKLESVYGINLQVSRDWFSAYAAYYSTKVYIPRASLEQAADNLEGFGAPPSATSLLRIDGDTGTFLGFGMGIDYADIIVNAEYSTVEIEDTLTLKNAQWYVMAGYRINSISITPYVMYETTENDPNTSTAKAFPAPLQPTVQGAFDAQQFEFKGLSAGVRYDFHSNAALKLEYNHYYDIVDLTAGVGTPADPDDQSVISVAVDVVF